MAGEAGNQRGISDSRGLSLLVVDVDPVLARAVGRTLSDSVAKLCLAESIQQASQLLAESRFDALIVGFDDERGRILLEAQEGRQPVPEVLVHTRNLHSPAAEWVRQRTQGEVLEKPAPVPVLLDWIKRVRAGRNGAVVRHSSTGRWGAQRIVGESRSSAAVRELVRRVAGFAAMPVLIVGEPGVGKTLVAQAIHEQSAEGEPFVVVSCREAGARIDTQLFGYDEGGTVREEGAFERAGRGTVVLKDVGSLPPSCQPRLLRAIETRWFSPASSERRVALRARIVSTSEKPLRELEQPLRKDLCSCLAGYNINLPPLRERLEDLVPLLQHLAAELRPGHDGATTFQEDVLEVIQDHSFPGNVRELRELLEKTLKLSPDGTVHAKILEDVLGTGSTFASKSLLPIGTEREPSRQSDVGSLVGEGRPFASLDALERHVILFAYEESDGNLSRAARTLGVARSTLRDRLRRYGIPLHGR